MTTTSNRNKKKRTSSKSRSRNRRRGRSSNLMLWLFLGVLVLLFAGIAFASRSGVGTTEITQASASGEALPEYPQGAAPEADPAVGSMAPEFSGETFDGEAVTITPGDGTPKAISFLAHWCPHCQREMPTVVDWVENGGLPEGVELIGVASDIDRNRPNFPPDTWFENEGWPGSNVVDGDSAVAQSYGRSGYPFWVLVDGDGNVVQRWSGETTAEQLDERIGQLAEG
jgi:thiol-disulfide isomerase/thioredoxin